MITRDPENPMLTDDTAATFWGDEGAEFEKVMAMIERTNSNLNFPKYKLNSGFQKGD